MHSMLVTVQWLHRPLLLPSKAVHTQILSVVCYPCQSKAPLDVDCRQHIQPHVRVHRFLQSILDRVQLLCRPFLLQSKASYTQIGIFSVASYPYSFKLLWSPIVDSIYSLTFGRRKSWVVPIQLASSVILLGSAKWLAGR